MSQKQANIEGIIERTLHIKTPVDRGTAFAVDIGDRQYLITAKHIVYGTLPGETMRIETGHGAAVVSPDAIALGADDTPTKPVSM